MAAGELLAVRSFTTCSGGSLALLVILPKTGPSEEKNGYPIKEQTVLLHQTLFSLAADWWGVQCGKARLSSVHLGQAQLHLSASGAFIVK